MGAWIFELLRPQKPHKHKFKIRGSGVLQRTGSQESLRNLAENPQANCTKASGKFALVLFKDHVAVRAASQAEYTYACTQTTKYNMLHKIAKRKSALVLFKDNVALCLLSLRQSTHTLFDTTAPEN